MKLGIMQPYFFPYIGYFQLIEAVDKIVMYDDVSYIKGGWINRNRIISQGRPEYISLILSGASSNKLINEVFVDNGQHWRKKNIRKLYQCYSKAEYFDAVSDLFRNCLDIEERQVGRFNYSLLKSICNYIGIETEFQATSSTYNNSNLSRGERIVDICVKEKAKEYINPFGGKKLYQEKPFHDKSIALKFLQPVSHVYTQFTTEFLPWMSILDVLMHNHPEKVLSMCKDFEIIQ